ncbi:hypothetical protein GCM10022398_22070 [Acetobacter lovaniensis]
MRKAVRLQYRRDPAGWDAALDAHGDDAGLAPAPTPRALVQSDCSIEQLLSLSQKGNSRRGEPGTARRASKKGDAKSLFQ